MSTLLNNLKHTEINVTHDWSQLLHNLSGTITSLKNGPIGGIRWHSDVVQKWVQKSVQRHFCIQPLKSDKFVTTAMPRRHLSVPEVARALGMLQGGLSQRRVAGERLADPLYCRTWPLWGRQHHGVGRYHLWQLYPPLRTSRGSIDRIEVRRNEVLEPIVQPFSENLGANFIFVDNNAHHHWAKVVNEFLEDHGIKCMVGTQNSPDLNPIENVWDTMGRSID